VRATGTRRTSSPDGSTSICPRPARRKAQRAGELLAANGLRPDVVHTSVLRRAIRSGEIALAAADRHWIPVRRSWRLNERHYGALQGKDKAAVRAEFGDEQFMLWRRSYDTPPPPTGRRRRVQPGC